MPKYMPRMSTSETGKVKDGAISLSYPMLTRENYTAWALKMRAYMQAHGVWEAIEPKDPKTVLEDRTDKIALAAIYQCVPEDILLSIADKKTAKQAWDAVKVTCQGAERVRTAKVQTLKNEFESLTMKDSDSLDDFHLKLKGIVTNIRALGEEVSDSYVVKKILRAVPPKFLQIASTIEQFGDLKVMTVEETVGSLKAHEERIRGHSDSNGGQLLLTEEEWVKREKAEGKLLLTREEWLKRTNKGGTEVSQGQRNRGKDKTRFVRDKSKVRCFNFLGYGHFAADCQKEKRKEERKEEVNISQIPDDEPALLVAEVEGKMEENMLINEEKMVPKLDGTKEIESNLWYLDNGASNHMTGQRSKFDVLDENVTGKVKFGDGSMVQIKGRGSIILKCKNGEERVLKEVYYIPSLCNNIISLGQLSEDGNKVIMSGDHLWVRDNKGELIMKVKKSFNRLYKIILENSESKCLVSSCDKESWLWHKRFGHVNFKAIKLMSSTQMVHGMPSVNVPGEICRGCLQSKQTRRPFPSQSSFSAKKPLELVHGDLCGPITPSTTAGNKYIFLLVDDFSRVMWIYLLKNKFEVFEAFKNFRALVETQDKKIKTFRTDRGGEFTSKEFMAYCEEAGIVRHLTAPYTPQQNGVVERRNRTMVEMARSFLKEMKMPCTFWGEAIRHSIYILNRLPTRAVTGVTPYEAWSELKPHVGHIRVFGCTAHMKVPGVKVSKLDDRSIPVVNLGKEPGSKAYRLYDPETGRIFVSRDVIFEEDKPWNWEQGKENTEPQPGVFTVAGIREELPGDFQNEDDIVTPQGSSASSDSESTEVNPQSTEPSSESDVDGDATNHRSLRDIYAETEQIELEDEELFLMGVDEPANYSQAAKDMN